VGIKPGEKVTVCFEHGRCVCNHCGITLEKIKDEFEPPGTFYHAQDSWYATMLPKIIESSQTCPNAGKKFRFPDAK